ncbi:MULTISPECIES: hypothetical protein [Aneurinibacillus]|uniref:Methyl-accepting chemotaxis protein n=1 Tax=Aneurinibacillus thermoaerophilus TaxID=143495 RepID=A0A1G8ADA0_ANETH|nr:MULTISPECIES: hypothetical protein [Aneurinibacillus]AMA73494.1 hypothetical protein ACH33_11925 [Aneurinibacillus sp. XH2]MED0676724.1 hypothetical protein [Aneurinibacillus thermoaerophilus]MED0680007.1 hypothetical protein [Aneurinibacillus thermoaerophilus]MED0738476.1 hypothetical protein [Aneurinibacillus thermoaerophilus]MED0756118.1 hypothetical protein [Aneurinibacillus thermoaerophilus]
MKKRLDCISENIEHVLYAWQEISSIIQESSTASEVATAAQQQSATIEEMAAGAEETTILSNELKAELGKFTLK